MAVLKDNIFSILLFAAIAAVFIAGLGSARRGSAAEELRIAEESLRRAVVSCYAVEGTYPESYEYIKENYSVRINEDKYVVLYEIFGSNIMPEITVFEVIK